MDDQKKEGFVKRYGKKSARLNMAKGGVVRRQFAQGGQLAPDATTLGGTASGNVNSAVNPNSQGFTGAIGGALGLNNQFSAAAAPVQAGTNQAQLNAAYTNTQGALAQQQQLANQTAGQGGFGNQSDVFNQQQALANQLQQQSLGGGPNPALAQLNQTTGQNIANQGALIAGQRGASSNVGLIARQAAQQGAATQEQAAGQAATMRAQQQLAAEQQLGAQQAQLQGVAANQIGAQGQAATNLTNAQLGEQGQLQAANTAYNNNVASQQAGINNVNSQTAQANANSNSNVLSGIEGVASNIPIIGGLFAHGGPVKMAGGGDVNLGAIAPTNASAGSAGPGPSIPGSVPLPVANDPEWAQKDGGGGSKKRSSPISSPEQAIDPNAATSLGGPMSSGGIDNSGGSIYGGGANFMGPMQEGLEFAPEAAALFKGGNIHPGPHKSHVANYLMASGGKVPALVSKDEVYLSPEKVQQVLNGADPMKVGQKFMGGKAKVKDDSKKNDTIPVTLEEGGCVIPRHITTHKMASEKAELFVRRAMSMKRAS